MKIWGTHSMQNLPLCTLLLSAHHSTADKYYKLSLGILLHLIKPEFAPSSYGAVIKI